MNFKKALVTVVKTLVTIGIFVSLFVGSAAARCRCRARLCRWVDLLSPNPERPGFVGR
jgi:hypothetical protein